MKRQANPWKNAIALTILITGVFAVSKGQAMQQRPTDAQFEAKTRHRAEMVFQWDRENPRKIPAHLLRQVSVALTFGNYRGAATILDQIHAR